jgi:hypothetical protein
MALHIVPSSNAKIASFAYLRPFFFCNPLPQVSEIDPERHCQAGHEVQ